MNSTRRILLVEDNPLDAEMVMRVLNKTQLANPIDHVLDGVEAVDYLNARKTASVPNESLPLVVLLDLQMPRLSGIGVLRVIKADPVLRILPVVVLTSSAEERDLVECYGLGANGYVVKPVNFTSFLDTIRRVADYWVSTNLPPLHRAE